MGRFSPFEPGAGRGDDSRTIERAEIFRRPAEFAYIGSENLGVAPRPESVASIVIASAVPEGWMVEVAMDHRPSVQQAFLDAYRKVLGPLHKLADELAAEGQEYLDILMEWAQVLPEGLRPGLKTIAAFCVCAEMNTSQGDLQGEPQLIVPRITLTELPGRNADLLGEPPDPADEIFGIAAAVNHLPRYDEISQEVARDYC